MVLPDSRRIPRVPRYLGAVSTKTHPFRVRGSHPLWPHFPVRSAKHAFFQTSRAALHRPQNSPATPALQQCKPLTQHRFRLFPVRSPLLGESRLFSFPPGTEMVQFPGYRFRTLCIHARITGIPTSWVTPFGHPRITKCVLLPGAFRSLPRPSSPASS